MASLADLFPTDPPSEVKKRSRPDYYARCGPGKRPKFAAFDFETAWLGGPVTFCTYYTEGMLEDGFDVGVISKGDIVQQMFFIMCSNPEYTWFAHNMQYDARYFIERLEEIRDRVQFFLRTDSDVFMITVSLPEITDAKGRTATLVIRDSYALWPEKLAKLAEHFCPELPKGDLDFEKVSFDPKNPEHVAYAKRDAEALLVGLVRFNALLYQHFGVNVRTTTASTALAAWQRTLGKEDRYYNSKVSEEFVRSGYYGGLVFLTSTGKFNGAITYDRNSSYPAEMLGGHFPEGPPTRCRYIHDQYLGLYDVSCTAPDGLVVPILPKRDSQGIVWPSGTFRTVVTSDEIKFARSHGYIIHQVHDGMIWPKTCSPFSEFINKCRDIRFTWPKSALDQVAKRMQNSTYGKYGSKRTRRKLYTTLPLEEQIGCEVWGDYLIREEYAEDMQCLPQWAVFITARARLALLSVIYQVGPENVLYGDTDSVTLKPGFTLPEGTDYGEWKKEKTWSEFRARGPKIYAGRKEGEEEITGAAKGIPKGQWKKSGIFEAILDGAEAEPVKYKRLEKFIQVLKTRHLGEYDAHRNLSSLANSRSWRLNSDGRVRPRAWSEIEARQPKRGSGVDHVERIRSPQRGPRAA